MKRVEPGRMVIHGVGVVATSTGVVVSVVVVLVVVSVVVVLVVILVVVVLVEVLVVVVVEVLAVGSGVYCACTYTATTPSWLLAGVGWQMRWVSLTMVAGAEVGVGRVANTQNKATAVVAVVVVVVVVVA